MHADRMAESSGQESPRPERSRAHAWRILAVTVASLAMLTSGAYAYWQSSGKAARRRPWGRSRRPRSRARRPAAGIRHPAWSAVTPPGARNGRILLSSQATAALPPAAARARALPRSREKLYRHGRGGGIHEFTGDGGVAHLDLADQLGSAIVTFGQAAHWDLEAASIAPLPEADNLTITAEDSSGNAVSTYSGSHTLVFEGSAEALSATKPTVVDRSGVAKPARRSDPNHVHRGRASVSAGKNGVLRLYRAEAAA